MKDKRKGLGKLMYSEETKRLAMSQQPVDDWFLARTEQDEAAALLQKQLAWVGYSCADVVEAHANSDDTQQVHQQRPGELGSKAMSRLLRFKHSQLGTHLVRELRKKERCWDGKESRVEFERRVRRRMTQGGF